MSVSLVTLAEVKAHLYLQTADTTHDNDLNLKIEIVSDMILDEMKLTYPPDDWTDDASPPVTTVPDRVRGVALLLVGRLYEDREGAEIMTPAIRQILKRPPALA